jgi:radical SAM superfamily enzyme YgiQ (UPF0313 family)
MTKTTTVFPLIIADNMWTLPYLSTGMISAYLKSWQDSELLRDYTVLKPLLGGLADYPLQPLIEQIAQQHRPICLLSSYVWNHQANMQAAREIRARNADAIIIFGGPEVPKYIGVTEQFLEQNPCIDIAILGEGEVACAEVLQALVGATRVSGCAQLEQVAGIVFQSDTGPLRTAERTRLKHIDHLPSPYLQGEFEPWFRNFSNAILETNRGCPYGCTYCDWGSATLEKISKFDPQRVIAEIEYIAGTGAEVIFIADANFGMLEQDIEIAKALVEIKARTGFPKKLNTNFAKNGGRRLMAVIKILHDGGLLPTGIIALQTTDEKVLAAIKRDNIKTASYIKMMEYFNGEGIPMASDIMIGLPGQTVDSLARDLQFCFDWKVSANGNYTSMMPNAPMAEESYVQEHMIVTDGDGLIESTSTFSREDLHTMKCLYMTYQFHVRLGILKYYLYYLQLEFGIAAIDFLRRWLDRVRAQDALLPISRRLFEEVFAMETRSGDWALFSWGEEAGFFFQDIEQYYQEIYQFSAREFGVELAPSVRETLFEAQAAVMPRMERRYPWQVDLKHDVLGYFEQLKQAPSVDGLEGDIEPLVNFPPGELAITPRIVQKKRIEFVKISCHSDEWELPSKLRFY